jgi:pyruvate/2-oxoglutarate dehydrogenase complex dihydrolipoamide acyltransferase (E2) component
MSTEILLPKLGFNAEDGRINEWLAADGAQVVEGEPLYVMESDKSSVEVEAPATGLLTILGEVGESYPIDTVIGRID